jgi:urea transport system permease protein
LIPAIVAGLLGYLVFRNRIRGVYFSILTQAALVVFFNLSTVSRSWINGTNGLKTDTSIFLGQEVGSDRMQMTFYLITVVMLVLMYAALSLAHQWSLWPLLVAIRDDENRVRFSGYDPTSFKVLVFAVSGRSLGSQVRLYTVQSGIVSPPVYGHRLFH